MRVRQLRASAVTAAGLDAEDAKALTFVEATRDYDPVRRKHKHNTHTVPHTTRVIKVLRQLLVSTPKKNRAGANGFRTVIEC